MGTTVIKTMTRGQDGLQLLENFESVNFMSDQGWTLLNGVPSTSTAVAYNGSRSFIMDLTYPLIRKTFTTAFKYAIAYFYDDASETTSLMTPFVKFTDTSASARVPAIGVDNFLSTSHYCYHDQVGALTASSVARSTGWHRFEMLYSSTFNTVILKVDGTTIYTGSVPAALSFTKIDVGCLVASGTPAFGYFDLIQVMRDSNIVFAGLGVANTTYSAMATLYDSAGNVLVTSSVSGQTWTVSVANLNMPFEGYLRVTDIDGSTPLFLSPVLSLSLGDYWRLNTFDLGRRVSAFTKPRQRSAQNSSSTSGKDQTLIYFSRDTGSITLTDLTDAQAQSLQQWWGHAQSGAKFSIAIDSDDMFEGLLTAATTAGTSTITVDQTVGVNKGSQLMITHLNGQTFEVATVLSKTTSTITFTAPLVQAYAIGDGVRCSYYWPRVITTDQGFDPRIMKTQVKRWLATIGFKEAL